MEIKSKIKFLVRQFPFIYPSKLIYSCQEWIEGGRRKKGTYYGQRGPWFKTIFSETFLQNTEPKSLGNPNKKAFSYNNNYHTAKASLFYLQNSYLMGYKGLVLTAKHEVFQEFTHHFAISSLKKFLWRNPFYTFTTDSKKIDGTGAVLISPESNNYYHWLNDVIARIKIYEPVLDQIDHFCVASNVPAKFLDILPDFGIMKRKIRLIEDKQKVHFDHLYVASLPGSEGRSPKWAVDYIREKLIKQPEDARANKDIYLKRGTHTDRKVINEDAIIAMLENNGFEIIDPGDLSIYDQIALMQQAQIIVSAHGAALTNLLFSRENATVIEIFSPDYFRTDCYYTLSSILKLNYWYIVGEKPPGADWGDIMVSESLLTKTIEQANGR